MFRYAQIDTDTARAISVSFLAGEVEADHMIPLEDEADVQPGDIYTDGEWIRPAPEPLPESGPTAAERIAQLEAENAGMALELAENQIRFDHMEQTQADLLLSLVDKGVL